MSSCLAILILAQTVSPSPAAIPDDGPPPPSIVERIGAPVAAPAASPTPLATASPTPLATAAPTTRAAAPPAPIPTAVPIAAPALAAPVPKAVRAATPVPTARAVPAAAPRTSPPRASAFGVHVSSFRKRETAEADGRSWSARLGLPARVLEVDLGAKGVWHRVVVGDVGSAAEAAALREQMKEKGIPDGVVLRLPR